MNPVRVFTEQITIPCKEHRTLLHSALVHIWGDTRKCATKDNRKSEQKLPIDHSIKLVNKTHKGRTWASAFEHQVPLPGFNFHHTKNFLYKLLVLALPKFTQDSVCLKGKSAKKGGSERKEVISFFEARSTSVAKAVVITVHLHCNLVLHRWQNTRKTSGTDSTIKSHMAKQKRRSTLLLVINKQCLFALFSPLLRKRVLGLFSQQLGQGLSKETHQPGTAPWCAACRCSF